MQGSDVDVDAVIDKWKEWKKKNVAHQWMLFYNDDWRAEGEGFQDFKAALISISDGKGWPDEGNDPDPNNAYPVLGVYKFPADDNIQRIKLCAFGYCDDSKPMGGMMKAGRKKMQFTTVQNKGKEEWFEGIKGPKVVFWASEGDITEDNMKTWFYDGDRV